MKTSLHHGLLLALGMAACNRPDSDLFSASGAPKNSGDASGGNATGQSGTPSVSESGSGATPTNGGAVNQAGSGGSAQPGGGAAATGNGGDAGTPADPGGVAGANDGAAGSGEPPVQPDPVCGNGVIEAGEQCDDAGHSGQDGCDANCQVVCSQHGAGTLESADHHCYNGYDQATFDGAEQACQQRGAHLASIRSADENSIARMLVNNSKWIGGFEDVSAMSQGTGAYGWITGEAFDYTNWGPKEPNRLAYHCDGGSFNVQCYEHCIVMLGDGTWADHRCDMADGYVCEWDPPSAP